MNRLMGDGSEYIQTAIEAVIEIVSMRCSSLVAPCTNYVM